MEVFRIPVTWEVCDWIEVEAETLEQAIEIFDAKENSDDEYALPTEPEYIDGSFKRETDIEYIRCMQR